jgi:hypothetical protein
VWLFLSRQKRLSMHVALEGQQVLAFGQGVSSAAWVPLR